MQTNGQLDGKKAVLRDADTEHVKAAELTDAGMNTMDALKHCLEDDKLIGETLKGLLGSSNRHGDLQVVRSAALRIAENAGRLIEAEESLPVGAARGNKCHLCAAGNPRVRSSVSKMFVHTDSASGRKLCLNQSEAGA